MLRKICRFGIITFTAALSHVMSNYFFFFSFLFFFIFKVSPKHNSVKESLNNKYILVLLDF